MNDIYPWQQAIWQKVASTRRPHASIHDPSISHALLLKGRKGLGKLSFASYLAKARLCRNPTKEEEACDSCASCRWFEQGAHPDFRLVQPEALPASSAVAASPGDTSSEGDRDDGSEGSAEATPGPEAEPGNPKSRKKPSKQISVEQIRALADFINISSHQGGYKIVVIHPAETMNLAAANALLKNLEEPPPLTLFILVAHQSQHLLATIRSRCVQISMPVPEPSVSIDWLRARGVKNAELCLASAGYAPLSALEFDDETYHERHLAFIKHISVPGRLNPISLVEGLQKTDLPTIVNWLQKWCYDLLSFRIAGKIRYHHDQFVAIEALAPTLNPQALVTYLRTLTKIQQLASHPLNERLFLEEMLFSYILALNDSHST
ncbi:MAG TPA: DNA polymerase III subunit delta' [Nitrosospira sp.]|nr:DNA polymerase III subunit delta' [Nitrosospira sp.]